MSVLLTHEEAEAMAEDWARVREIVEAMNAEELMSIALSFFRLDAKEDHETSS